MLKFSCYVTMQQWSGQTFFQSIPYPQSNFIFPLLPDFLGACDTVNSNPEASVCLEIVIPGAFCLCFRAFLLLMAALAFMSLESSFLIRGAIGKSIKETSTVYIQKSPVAPHEENQKKRKKMCASLIRVMAEQTWLVGVLFSQGALDGEPV